jgi:hypothetical protein
MEKSVENDFERMIKLIEKTKIKKGWFVYYSEVTKEKDLDRMQSKRARLVQITNYKKKESKTGIVTYRISFFDGITKRISNRNIRLDQNQKSTRGWAFALTKKKSELDHEELLKDVIEKYELQLEFAKQKIEKFRGGD